MSVLGRKEQNNFVEAVYILTGKMGDICQPGMLNHRITDCLWSSKHGAWHFAARQLSYVLMHSQQRGMAHTQTAMVQWGHR